MLPPIWLFSLLCMFLCGCTHTDGSSVQKNGFISLSPAITEIIYALNGQEQLIGRSDYCFFPQEAKHLPSFGTALTPNLEQIAQQNPAGLLFDGAFGTPKKELSALSEVHVYPWLTSSDLVSSITQLGELLNKETKAQDLAQEIQRVFATTSDDSAQSMIALMSGSDIDSGVFWYMRSDSLHGEAVEAAGFRNVAPSDIQGPPSMSAEELLARNPDIILFVCSPEVDEKIAQQLVEKLSKFTTLTAVQKNRVGYIIGENRMGIGPTIVDLVQEIKRKGSLLLEAQ